MCPPKTSKDLPQREHPAIAPLSTGSWTQRLAAPTTGTTRAESRAALGVCAWRITSPERDREPKPNEEEKEEEEGERKRKQSYITTEKRGTET